MMLGLTRIDLQELAQAKIEDAIILLNADRPANAYYLAGYAVEIGLKACISRQIQQDTLPAKGFVEEVYRYGHDLEQLVKLAGLQSELIRRQEGDVVFEQNWSLVVRWRPESRYRMTDIYTAQLMLAAVQDEESGFLPWVKTHW